MIRSYRWFRKRQAYRPLLDRVPLRISVTGVRGKTSLVRLCEEVYRERGYRTFAKLTGTVPLTISDGAVRQIHREPGRGVLMDETMNELYRSWHPELDVMVLENQAISPYTMRVFNGVFCRPQYVLLTNVRADHLETLGRTRKKIAEGFASSVPKGSTVISGETREDTKTWLAEALHKRGATFIDASDMPDGAPPGFESVLIVDALLRETEGEGLGGREIYRRRRAIGKDFAWQTSSLRGVKWFPGAEINDVDSTAMVLDHLLQKKELPVSFVACLRRDRVDRTATFAEFFSEEFQRGRCTEVYVTGPGSGALARRLRPWSERVHIVPDKVSEVPRMLDLLSQRCRGGAVMTVANATPPFAQALTEALTK